MIGKRTQQSQLFDVGNVYDLELPPSSFYAQLAQAAPELFQDDDFAALYAKERGRPSVPPSQLALVMLLQHHDQVSDEEAIARTAFDLRWAAVLRRPAGRAFCAKSTLQLFRAHLLIHKKIEDLFVKSIEVAKKSGLLHGSLKAAIDTKPILGRGAVRDTYNLLGDAISLLARQLAKEEKQTEADYLREAGLERYLGTSLKGSADIDWSEPEARHALLTQIVQEARLLLSRADGASPEVREAASLLSSILLQDVEETAGDANTPPSAKIKKGTTPGRIASTTDPQQRHGHKSEKNLFHGSKASVVADVDSQIILAACVLAGDAPDKQDTLQQIETAEANSGLPVVETQADCAYGDGGTRQEFVDAGRTLLAKVPQEARRENAFPKSRFEIDLQAQTVTCPAGNTTAQYHFEGDKQVFSFGSACRDCPLRAQCTTNRHGRKVQVHPQEALIREARAYQQTPEGRAHLRQRVVVEHTLARLSHLGIGQARYFGRVKSGFQLLMACTVVNLRRVWNWTTAQAASEALAGAI
jgi:hypothetical protein